MKTSFLTFPLFIVALFLGAACSSDAANEEETTSSEETTTIDYSQVTFTDWDNMSAEEQGDFLVDRAKKIHTYLFENDPAKAQCMIDRLVDGEDENYTEAFVELNRKIEGVPQERRGTSKVQTLMANYIIKDLCGDVTSKTAANSSSAQK